MDAVALVATVTTPQCAADLERIPRAVSWLQIRSDLIGDVPADWLRAYFPGKLLYTLRTHAAGGKFDRSGAERRLRLMAAAKDYDLVELEAEADLRPELLEAIPAAKRLILWRDVEDGASRLPSNFQKIAGVPARYYCLIASAATPGDGLHALRLLKSLRRADLVAYCDGPSGLWSRLLAPAFGAPLLFGQLDSLMLQPGEPHIQQMIDDYGFPAIPEAREIYGMVGNGIFKSPSPRLHNSAYKILNHPAMFLPFHADRFEDFWSQMVDSGAMDSLGVPIQGLVIVSPYKETALSVAGVRSPMVRKAGAGNVFMRREGFWVAETTDPESITPARHIFPARAAVIGCGGAGRAVAAALQQTGSEVTLVNRGPRRGEYAVQLLGLPFVPLSEFRAGGFDLIVNATPVGRDNDGFPFVIDSLSDGTLVVDLAYGSDSTPLVSAVLARGGSAIDGYDVLLTQVRKQFELLTGLEMPAGIDRKTVLAGRNAGFLSSQAALQTALGSTEAYECGV